MRGDPGDSEPVDSDEFDRIVADWRRENSAPAWPDDDEPASAPEPSAEEVAPDITPNTGLPTVDEGHFTPPDPPPLPPVGPPALVGLALLAIGLILVTVPWWIGIPDAYGLPLGLITLASGLGWLVLRLWPDVAARGDGDGPDDGAVL